jgi:hypothetical protein
MLCTSKSKKKVPTGFFFIFPCLPSRSCFFIFNQTPLDSSFFSNMIVNNSQRTPEPYRPQRTDSAIGLFQFFFFVSRAHIQTGFMQ